MARKSKFIMGSAVLILLGGGATAAVRANGGSEEGARSVHVQRGTIVAKALAVGTIQPETQISVKSKVSGVVKRSFVEEGDYVEAGAPLLEIRPDPTPLELVEARRAVQLREIESTNLRRELERAASLRERELVSQQDLDTSESRYREAALQLVTARERLELLETGRVTGSAGGVESVVRAPITGYILEKMVEVGDPVVPLSTYQEGTVLFTMADMGRLVFRGTVDEIDVGRLSEGLPVSITIGALPGTAVPGELSRISLKARVDGSATIFPVEIILASLAEVRLRAGFSANADIIMDERIDVLVVPERVVTFEGDSAWVEVPGPGGTRERRPVRTGLSDAIHVEIISGLAEGDVVLEKPLRTVAGGR
jgi:HlyD family secretion protein